MRVDVYSGHFERGLTVGELAIFDGDSKKKYVVEWYKVMLYNRQMNY